MKNLSAILLCGGKGERLWPLTDQVPKPMVQLRGKPILEHLIVYLRREGVEHFIVCTGYLSAVIEEYLQGVDFGAKIEIINDGDVGMTKRLESARAKIRDRALICYGDTLANVDVRALMEAHRKKKALATITIHPLRVPFGVVRFDKTQKVINFLEKPQISEWINIGFILCEAEAFASLDQKGDMVEYLNTLRKTERLFAYQHQGKHITVNTKKEKDEAEEDVVRFFTLIEESAA